MRSAAKHRWRDAVVWTAALCLIALTARLGFWQLDRAAQKTALHEAQLQQARAPALSLPELPATAAEAAAAEHRAVAVQGRWLPTHTVFLDNRPHGPRAGFHVLTPLALADGRMLIVQRGWWPRDAADRTRLAAPPPPAGVVDVRGRVALAPMRLFELAPEAGGVIRQNLDLDAYRQETRLPLLPWLLVQLDDPAQPVDDGLVRQWPEPAAGAHKNLGYAVQWFALAALVAVLLLWFQVWRPRRRRASSFFSSSPPPPSA
ncbi:MAG: SURF1 family protein [Betaproteobacteria bacterium]|nr:SURF1 family protein [Betaproteobacteria bacterium]